MWWAGFSRQVINNAGILRDVAFAKMTEQDWTKLYDVHLKGSFALTKAAIPTFEGFFFIFAQKPAHVIVETLLYLEISFILVNGAFLWLIFRERKPPTAEEIRAAMLEINRK